MGSRPREVGSPSPRPVSPPPVTSPEVRFVTGENGARLAYVARSGATPTVVFLGGYASDMTGTKAGFLEAWCEARGQAFLRFDYQGHGQSSGALAQGTIGAWRDDALAVVRECVAGPVVLVGSSMGAWVMVLAAIAMPERVHALVGVAAAPDFTEDLLWAALDADQRRTLQRDGILRLPSSYGEPLPFTWRLVEDGRRHLVLRAPLDLGCPVRLIHGTGDLDVPWMTSLRLVEAIRGPDVTLTLVKDGGHRLSEPRDLALLGATVASLL
jgi:pimeloyl-ACP methyl ester carboxylesterase